MELFQNVGVYKHFKGGEYKLICNVENQNGESMVLYKSIKSNSYWLRPQNVFFEMVTRDGETFQRFTKVKGFVFKELMPEYDEFLERMRNGEEIINEIDLEKYKLTKEYPLTVGKA